MWLLVFEHAISYSCEELHLISDKNFKRENNMSRWCQNKEKGAQINREADAGEEQHKTGIITGIERFSLTLWDSCENLMPLLFMPEELCNFQNTIIKLDRTPEKLK